MFFSFFTNKGSFSNKKKYILIIFLPLLHKRMDQVPGERWGEKERKEKVKIKGKGEEKIKKIK